MTAKFTVLTTSQFDRESSKLLKAHMDFDGHLAYAIEVLSSDPYNLGRQHPIKKLVHVAEGNGQYRIRSGRFRFRYDIDAKKQAVYLKACCLRRQDTY